FLTRRKLLKWGKARQFHEGKRLQHLQQGLGGIKDIKVLGREVEFINRYKEHNLNGYRVTQYVTFIQRMPRIWLEILAVFGVSAFIVIIVMQGKSIELLIPVLGLFAAAAFRIIPTANNLLNCVQK